MVEEKLADEDDNGADVNILTGNDEDVHKKDVKGMYQRLENVYFKISWTFEIIWPWSLKEESIT